MQSEDTVYDRTMVHEGNRRGFDAIFACAVLSMLALTAASNSEPAETDHGLSLEDIDAVVSRLEGIRELLTRRVRRTSMDELTVARAQELARDIGRLLNPTEQPAQGEKLGALSVNECC